MIYIFCIWDQQIKHTIYLYASAHSHHYSGIYNDCAAAAASLYLMWGATWVTTSPLARVPPRDRRFKGTVQVQILVVSESGQLVYKWLRHLNWPSAPDCISLAKWIINCVVVLFAQTVILNTVRRYVVHELNWQITIWK